MFLVEQDVKNMILKRKQTVKNVKLFFLKINFLILLIPIITYGFHIYNIYNGGSYSKLFLK